MTKAPVLSPIWLRNNDRSRFNLSALFDLFYLKWGIIYWNCVSNRNRFVQLLFLFYLTVDYETEVGKTTLVLFIVLDYFIVIICKLN